MVRPAGRIGNTRFLDGRSRRHSALSATLPHAEQIARKARAVVAEP